MFSKLWKCCLICIKAKLWKQTFPNKDLELSCLQDTMIKNISYFYCLYFQSKIFNLMSVACIEAHWQGLGTLSTVRPRHWSSRRTVRVTSAKVFLQDRGQLVAPPDNHLVAFSTHLTTQMVRSVVGVCVCVRACAGCALVHVIQREGVDCSVQKLERCAGLRQRRVPAEGRDQLSSLTKTLHLSGWRAGTF